jgi:amino acid efflux transporter
MTTRAASADSLPGDLRATWRVGLGLAGSVLGAGMLLVPPVTAGLAGDGAPAAWLITLLIGAGFSACLGLVARSVSDQRKSIFDVVGATLGDRARRVVLATYLAGFVIGQGAIAVAAGGFLAYALGLPGHAYLLGMLVLALATAASAGGVVLGDRSRRLRLAMTGAIALACCAWPQVFTASALLVPDPTWFGGALFVVLFAGVGWESSARIAPGLTDGRTVLRGVMMGAGFVLTGYLLLVVLLSQRISTAHADSSALRGLAALAAVVLTVYCLTNITAAARFVPALGGPDAGVARTGVGAASAAVVAIAAMPGWTVAGLLAGPSLATWLSYLLTMFGGARSLASGRVRAACIAVAALLLLVVGALAIRSI